MMADGKPPRDNPQRLVWPPDLPTDVKIIQKGVELDDLQRLRFRQVLNEYLRYCFRDLLEGHENNIPVHTDQTIDTLQSILRRTNPLIVKDLEDMQSGRLIDRGSPPIPKEQAEVERRAKFEEVLDRIAKRGEE